MDLSKSIDFLLENAGAVIQYRLRKEILNNISKTEEENMLEQVYQTPLFKMLLDNIKPNGFIGWGMHNGDKRQKNEIDDGEASARLLSYYGIPKENPIIKNFISAFRNEDTLQEEFSHNGAVRNMYKTRHIGTNSGNLLMSLIYTMQSMLGYGDDEEVKYFQEICLKGFKRVVEADEISDITRYDPSINTKLNYLYHIEPNDYFPCSYTLTNLAYTSVWRTPENIKMMANAINHINAIMPKSDTPFKGFNSNGLYVRINKQLKGPAIAFSQPLRAFTKDNQDAIFYRRPLTEIAMLGVGENVGIIRESVANVEEALAADGILKIKFDSSYNKRKYIDMLRLPNAYGDIGLEIDYKSETALWCDRTFWAVQFLTLVKINPSITNK